MKIPKKIDILGEEFAIHMVDDITKHVLQMKVKPAADNMAYYGYFDMQKYIIYIDSGLTKARQEQVLLHEILEVIVHQLVIKMSHDDLERMEHGLFYVLSKNKLLKE